MTHYGVWNFWANRVIDIVVDFGQNWFIAVIILLLFEIKTLDSGIKNSNDVD